MGDKQYDQTMDLQDYLSNGLSENDHGGISARGYAFQHTYAALLASMIARKDAAHKKVFCEFGEDILVQLLDDSFEAIQVKTSTNGPLTMDDILKTLLRFIKLEVNYPNSFSGYIIASNAPFSPNVYGLVTDKPQLIDQTRDKLNVDALLLKAVLNKLKFRPNIFPISHLKQCIFFELVDHHHLEKETIETVLAISEHLISKAQQASSKQNESIVDAFILGKNREQAVIADIVQSKTITRDTVVKCIEQGLDENALYFYKLNQRILPDFDNTGKKHILLKTPLQIGSIIFDNCILLNGVYENYEFIVTEGKGKPVLTKELIQIAKEIEDENERKRKDNKKKKEKDRDPIFKNLRPYCIKYIDFTRLADGKERSCCILEVVPSNYFVSRITASHLDHLLKNGKTIREQYYSAIKENPMDPSPEGIDLIHAFGVNLLVITSDNKVIIPTRHKRNGTGGGQNSMSVGEHFNKDSIQLDSDRHIDLKKVAINGIKQELGIKKKELLNEIKYITVGYMPKRFHYETIGIVRTKLDSEKIPKRLAVAKDGPWESIDVECISFSLEGVKAYLERTDIKPAQWLVVSLLLCLTTESRSRIPYEKIENAFTGPYWEGDFKKILGEY